MKNDKHQRNVENRFKVTSEVRAVVSLPSATSIIIEAYVAAVVVIVVAVVATATNRVEDC